MHIKSRLGFLLAWLLAFITLGARAAERDFVIGVIPVHSARVLVERYEPMRVYLEKQLKRRAHVETSPDFKQFHARTLRGDFDLTITPAHLARIAQIDAGHTPLAQFKPDHDSLLIYNRARPLKLPQDMRGHRLAVIDPLAMTVIAALSFFEQYGLEALRDYRVDTYHTHAGVAHALMAGLADVAVTTSQGLLQIPEDLRDKLETYKHIADIPAFVCLARVGMDKDAVAKLRAAILAFPQTDEGFEFLGRTGYAGVYPINESGMKRADLYLKQTRAMLKP